VSPRLSNWNELQSTTANRASARSGSGDVDPGGQSATVPAGLAVGRLRLVGFRNYRAASLMPDPRPLVLTGPNGAGKTNLLEAVSLLSPGRGLRRARLVELEHQARAAGDCAAGREAWSVAAELVTPTGLRSIGTGRDPASGPADEPDSRAGRRLVRIDGAPARSQQALGEIVWTVWLTPQMDGLFRGGAADRRRFLDRLVYSLDAEHAGRSSRYERLLRERTRLLRDRPRDSAWLSAVEGELAELGVAIAAARRQTVARLSASRNWSAGGFPTADLALDGEVESRLADQPALAVEDHMRSRLETERPRDAEAGGAHIGPHRSDLQVVHRATGLPAALCSTGEQKALLVAIVLAHARLVALDRGAAPLLLLDEVNAHLDRARRLALFEEIVALRAQAWLTGTDAEAFAALGGRAQYLGVQDGAISAQPVP